MVCAGTANMAFVQVLIAAGVNEKNIIEILHESCYDLAEQRTYNPVKWERAVKSDGGA